MKNGILYAGFNLLMEGLKWLSLVEYFKLLSRYFFKNKTQDIIKTAEKNAVDAFIILKWGLVVLAYVYGWENSFLTLVIWYLIVANIYTYFYYHVWDKITMNVDNFSIKQAQRRFLNLLLSIGFSNVSFAYLYKIPYYDDFNWDKSSDHPINSLLYSITNSIAANFSYVSPCTIEGTQVSLIQLFISFLFLTIILAKSMPQTSSST